MLDAALDRVEEMLDRASALPRLLAARRLAWQSTVTIALARRLLRRLRRAAFAGSKKACSPPASAIQESGR